MGAADGAALARPFRENQREVQEQRRQQRHRHRIAPIERPVEPIERAVEGERERPEERDAQPEEMQRRLIARATKRVPTRRRCSVNRPTAASTKYIDAGRAASASDTDSASRLPIRSSVYESRVPAARLCWYSTTSAGDSIGTPFTASSTSPGLTPESAAGESAATSIAVTP